MQKVDPITIATTWHYIQRVCREMRETTERTATNVLITTLHDLAYGIWAADGRVIAIPEGFPPRLISSTFVVKRVMEKFKDNICEGDVFLTNYPRDGAIHLPDWIFVRPIFHSGKLEFFTCMGTHVPDTGGAQPGSHFLAFDSIGEGLNIPLVKVVEKGNWREDVIELILANNRIPDMMRREMTSLIGSTQVAEDRMKALLDKYGNETVDACIDEMINRTEKAVRDQINTWPEGTYFAESQTDDDGATLGVPVTVRCKLTIKDGELTFDFSDTDAQVAGMINSHRHQAISDTLCSMFLFLGSDLSAYHNEGSLRPVHVVTKKGTIVDAEYGALTAAAPAVTGSVVTEAVISVLSQALPDKAITPYARLISPTITGSDQETGGIYFYHSFCPAAGAGAVCGYDGYQCCADMGTLGVVGKSDVEEEMVRFPWDIERYEFMVDSHGAGKWRGAPGIVWEGVNENGPCTSLGGPWNGFQTQGEGQQGGYPTPLNRASILRGEKEIPITQAHTEVELQPGDHLLTMTGGGAGVGKPSERDPEAVSRDVKNELVSLEMAKNIYKVVIRPDTMEIDDGATRKLRTS